MMASGGAGGGVSPSDNDGGGGAYRRAHVRSVSQGGNAWFPLHTQPAAVPQPLHSADEATTAAAAAGDRGGGQQHSILVGPRTNDSSRPRHQRTSSHGQTSDGVTANYRGHRRVGSRTDFILPEDHEQREKHRAKPQVGRTSSFPLGHTRNTSKTESIYTIRENKVPLMQRLFFWKKARFHIYP